MSAKIIKTVRSCFNFCHYNKVFSELAGLFEKDSRSYLTETRRRGGQTGKSLTEFLKKNSKQLLKNRYL